LDTYAEHFLQLSSNYEMVELESSKKFVELTKHLVNIIEKDEGIIAAIQFEIKLFGFFLPV